MCVKRDKFCTNLKTKETENVMQPFNRCSMNTSLDRSQILNYTTDFHFFPVRDGRFFFMQKFQISIPEVAEMFSSITGILKVSHISKSYKPKQNLLPSFSPDNGSCCGICDPGDAGAEGDHGL